MDTQGNRLKKIRQMLGLTQEQFGLKLGISKQFYSNIESDRTVLNNNKLVLLCTDYNVNTNYILAGIGEPFNPPPFEEVEDEFTARVRKIIQEELAKKRND